MPRPGEKRQAQETGPGVATTYYGAWRTLSIRFGWVLRVGSIGMPLCRRAYVYTWCHLANVPR